MVRSLKQVINFSYMYDSITYGLVKTTLKKLVRLTPPTNKATCTCVYFKTF